jgi:hypothetical protein
VKILDSPASGSFGGVTRTRGRAGQINRVRRIPVQPLGASRRSLVRGWFAAASRKWATLTAAQQRQWNVYAANHPAVDSLGQTFFLTGAQTYLQIYANLSTISYPIQATPPVAAENFHVLITTLNATHGASLNIAYTTGVSVLSRVVIGASRPMSPGRTFCDKFYQIFSQGAQQTGIINYYANYIARYGQLAQGRKLFVKLTGINHSGVQMSPSYGSCIIA